MSHPTSQHDISARSPRPTPHPRRAAPPRTHRARPYRPRLDALEDRTVPSLLPGNEFLINPAPQASYLWVAPAAADAPDGRTVVVSADTAVRARLYAADGTAATDLFQVNQDSSTLRGVAAAMDAQGAFVVAWQTDAGTLYARRYDSAGQPLANRFQVTTDVTGVSNYFDLFSTAMDSAGDFVIAWNKFDATGNSTGVFAQRYDATGTAQGTEFPVSQFASGKQSGASVAMDAAGDFVIGWQSRGQYAYNTSAVYARLYDTTGAAIGNEFLVSSYTESGPVSEQSCPSVAMDAAGAFLIAWQDRLDVIARRFDATGAPRGNDFQVSQYGGEKGASNQAPQVAMNGTGAFALLWNDFKTPPGTHYPYYPGSSESGTGNSVYGRAYDNSGQPLTAEFQVSQSAGAVGPSVAIDAQGDVFFAYLTVSPPTSTSGNGRRYVAGAAGYSYDAKSGTVTLTAPGGLSAFAYHQTQSLNSTNYTLTLNGVPQTFNAAAAHAFVVNAAGTGNTAVFATDDTYQDPVPPHASHETSEIVALGEVGGWVYKFDAFGNAYLFLQASGFATEYAALGRADSGQLLASYLVANTLVTAGGYSYLSSPGAFYYIHGGAYVDGYAVTPADVAYHYDGSGPSVLVLSGSAYSLMLGTDQGQSFCNAAVGFRVNYGIATHAGQDTAIFYDSPLNDVFAGYSDHSYLYAANADGSLAYYDQAQGFALVYAYSLVGGTDYAYVYDTTVNHTTGFIRPGVSLRTRPG